MIVSIVNMNIDQAARHDPRFVYAGRNKSRTHFGNPFTFEDGTLGSERVADRHEAVLAYREWLAGTRHLKVDPYRRLYILERIKELAGVGQDIVLGCFCKIPGQDIECHCDVLKDMILEKVAEHAR